MLKAICLFCGIIASRNERHSLTFVCCYLRRSSETARKCCERCAVGGVVGLQTTREQTENISFSEYCVAILENACFPNIARLIIQRLTTIKNRAICEPYYHVTLTSIERFPAQASHILARLCQYRRRLRGYKRA